MVSTIRFLRVFTVVTLVLGVVISVSAWAPPTQERLTTLTAANALQPSSLDVAVEYEAACIAVNRAVYEKLVRYKADSTDVEPELATSWEVSDDGKTWTFKLRDGVKFHDGTPFNAEAVKFSYERVITINQGPAWMFEKIDHIEVVDDLTVRFHLKEPFGAFLPVLANIFGTGIVSPKAVKDHEKEGDLGQEWMRDHMVGTGPFKFVEWVHGEQIVLERFKDYWRGWDDKEGKYLDKVIIKFITEPAIQRLLLEKGDLDIAMNISVDDLEDVAAQEGIVLVEKPSLMATYIRFNVEKPPVNDKRVRQAIMYALDWDGVINQIMRGHALQMQGAAAIGLPGHNDDLPIPKQDMEKAKQFLAEAGYPEGGFKLEYVYETGQEDRRKVGELLQANLAELGINMEIRTLPWESLWARVSSEDHMETPELCANGWWPDYADVLNYLYPMYHSTQSPPTALNIGFYANPEVDKLLDDSLAEIDDAKRFEMYKKAQQLIFDDTPDIDLYQKTMTIMMRDWVKGYIYNPIYTEGYNLYDMYLERSTGQ